MPENIPIWLMLLGSALSGAAAVLGIKEIIAMLVGRRLKKQDALDEAHISTQAKKIEAGVDYSEIFIGRIEKLELRVEKLEEQNMDLTKTNIRLETENQHLKETNVRQAKRIDDQETEIKGLRSELAAVRRESDEMRLKFNELSILIGNLDANDAATQKAAETAEKELLRLKPQWSPQSVIPVLIIDDDGDTRDLLAKEFELAGIESKSFDSGMIALEWLTENEAKAVILDLAMPVIDGLALAGHIRTNESLSIGRAPAEIAFYTGHHPDGIVEKAQKKCSVRNIFIKGVDDANSVVLTVSRWLKARDCRE